MRKVSILSILFCLIAFPVCGATYYVDATDGDDNKDGLSEANAWKTINKINSSSFNPGDSILFQRGEIWRERLVAPSSGSSGSSITFMAYGIGNNPIITGANTSIGFESALEDDLFDQGAGIFTSGTYSWTAYGNNTIANDNNALKISHVDNINGAYNYLRDSNDLMSDLIVGETYKFTYDAKVGDGDSVNFQITHGGSTDTITNTTFQSYIQYFSPDSATFAVIKAISMSAGEIIWLDNLKIQKFVPGVYVKDNVTTEPHIVIYNGSVLKENDGATSLLAFNEWDWAADSLYVNVQENPDNGILEVGVREAAISVTKDYIIIDGIEIQGANGSEGGIYIGSTANDVTIQNTVIKNSFAGIFGGISITGNIQVLSNIFHDLVETAIAFNNPDQTDNTIQDNLIYNVGGFGGGQSNEQGIYAKFKNSTIKGNEIYNCGTHDYYDHLIYLSLSNNVVIEDNILHDAHEVGGCGIKVSSCDSVTVQKNLIYNTDKAIILQGTGSYNNRIINNTIYGDDEILIHVLF